MKKNWWLDENQNNALAYLSDGHILDFIQNIELARRDFDSAFALLTQERKDYLTELVNSVSLSEKSRILDAVEKSDQVQKRANRLTYFHGMPRKKRGR